MHIIQVLRFTIAVYINQSPRDIFAKTAYLQKRPNDVIYEREQTLKIKMFTFISNKFNHKTQGTEGRKSEGIRGSQRISDLGHYLYQCPVVLLRYGYRRCHVQLYLCGIHHLRLCTIHGRVHHDSGAGCCIGVCRSSCGLKWGGTNNKYGNSVRLRQPRHGVRASICEIEYQGVEVRYRGDENYQVGDEVTLTL